MAEIIQLRRDTSANFTETNRILAQGEPALEIDTLKEKIGDGVTAWVDLAYKPGTGVIISTKELFTATAAQTEFVLSNTPNNVDVIADRVPQIETIDYTIVGDTITMTDAQDSGTKLEIRKY